MLLGLFLLTLPLVNPYIRGDGNGYYAYVRSVVIDGDLRFENEYRRGDPAFVASVIGSDGRVSPSLTTGNGYVRNQWAVGPSILWAPAFLLGHGVAWAPNAIGWPVPADGYSSPYRWLCALATAVYAFLGLTLACATAKQFVSPGIAAAATMGVWFASPLPVYMYFLPFHVHALSAFAVALFLWYWIRTHESRTAGQWGLWGLSAGLMVEVYYLNVVCLLIPLLELGREMLRHREPGGCDHARVLLRGVVFGVGVVTALLPHLVIKTIIHGSPLRTGYEDQFFWASPRIWHVAFASEHGMFLWTPILLLSVIGVGILWRADRWTAAGLTLVFVAHYAVVASYENWHGQSAFGNRFFVSLTPVFVVGLAAFLACAAKLTFARRRPWLACTLLLAPLIFWNVGLMFQWGTGLVPNRGPIDFGVATRNQVTRVPGLLVDFFARYLSDRGRVIGEIEQGDLDRARHYHPRR